MTALRTVARAVGALLLVPVAVVAWEYAWTPVYHFPPPRPFAGARWYNPYEAPLGAVWRAANFHAHSAAWGSLTNGHQSAAEVRAAYRRLGADVAQLSNYHLIDSTGADSTFIPTYEYGYSITKTHRLALGARGVNWLDFPLGQSRDEMQLILDRLRATAALTVINHPVMRHGHTATDLAALGNYDLIEAVSSYGDSPAEWDAALSSGHAVWALGSDDNHDVTRADLLGRCWTMVLTTSTLADAVLQALKAGRQVAVRGAALTSDNGIRGVAMLGDTLTVTLERVARHIRFIGDGGRELAEVRDAATARHVAGRGDSYVRIVIENAATTIWTNPVVRWDGVALPDPRPTLDVAATWALRLGIIVLYGVVVILARTLLSSRRHPS